MVCKTFYIKKMEKKRRRNEKGKGRRNERDRNEKKSSDEKNVLTVD